ncbi:RsmB/NOP family class I SAM-dependent RNA methyltransferase [Falsarthrobacter nasiphocae]|uniref:16S rRNA (Cytosine967-C5)-methyltransferase n=1 Tax=Falsarthrobacter nasiphocae TaxID=189863 RepID=A0AAE3YD71_9MICC|nr:transcription antitermination factor NusB [Falsarthrobacter nasiphocae]MDR6891239.1 16S rRNA (cytosine967-C5)-methyltransferase [Falsarthrobacter nasiphocae]
MNENTPRRNDKGRTRNRGGERHYSTSAPSARRRTADPARLVAFEVLEAVSNDDAYANLVLPSRIRAHRLDKRSAGLATELAYGSLRWAGTYDLVLAECIDRPLAEVDSAIVNALRLGTHQLLNMRVPHHAALSETVALVRERIGAGPSGFVNAVLRRVSETEAEGWTTLLLAKARSEAQALGIEFAHPEWIVRALRQSLVIHGSDEAQLPELLAADNAAPAVNLVALPGLGSLDEALAEGAAPGELVADSATTNHGDLGRLASVREGTVRVQDVGSQLVARAFAQVPVETGAERDGRPEAWLDACAGPGGKAALLGALAQERGFALDANEPQEHRADLVERAFAPLDAGVWRIRVGDAREIGEILPNEYDRVLVDVPCSGLGALRRRPESRWRRSPEDIAGLGPLQREILESALKAVRPGGVVGYVTCSPHPAETVAVVDDVLARWSEPGTRLTRLSARGALDAVALTPLFEGTADRQDAQLWPHVHGTDAMFLSLIRKDPAS